MQVITKGVALGENVVVEGMQKLRQGMVVKTTPWQIPPGFAEEPDLPAPAPPDDKTPQKIPLEASPVGTPAANPEPSATPAPAA
jgi:hypothetical protein